MYSVDGVRRWAEAVAIAGGRIRCVGPAPGAARFVGERTRVVDLDGRMLLPGFQDVHGALP